MKNILIVAFLLISSSIFAQTYTSSKLPYGGFKTVSFSDEKGDIVLTMEKDFDTKYNGKKNMKSFFILDKKYVITREAKGIQHVYTGNWELVASMTKKGTEIIITDTNTTYAKKKDKNRLNKEISYVDQNNQVAGISKRQKKSSRILEYTNLDEQEENLLLMALSLHQHIESIKREDSSTTYLTYGF